MSDTASMMLPWTHARHHHHQHQHASADGESVNSLSRPGGEHMLHTSTQVTTYHLHQPWPVTNLQWKYPQYFLHLASLTYFHS